jgi:tetratricopeptide (TPR) repeat protein
VGFFLIFGYTPNVRTHIPDPDNFFLILVPACFYLSTLAPSIDYRDSPEFIDTSFALGVSHPAGFPTYNLLVKAFTFLPLGSIALKVNLFSLVFASLTLVFLYLSANIFLEILFGSEKPKIIAGLFPVLLLAFSQPFWYHALVAEVYTLHSFFTCLIIYLLLSWKLKEDVRFLYAAAFFYGLSAGNHATVVFYLPAILLLFFVWERKARFKNLLVVSLVFLIGFSVYLYLPIRSFTEPTIDWGNPESFQEFIYHITDRQHAETHFGQLPAENSEKANLIGSSLSLLAANILHVLKMLVQDLNQQLGPVIVVGFFMGSLLCFKANRPLFFFFLLIVAVNASFFVGWRKESYFPTYIAACLWTSAFLFWLIEAKFNRTKNQNNSPDIQNGLKSKEGFQQMANRQALVTLVLTGFVVWLISSNYYKVDRSGNYFAESLLKRMVLSLDDNSVFVAGISWFNSAYHQDVMRIRDDVTFVKAWDFLDAHPPSFITSKRYPDLKLPSPENHRFGSREESYSYMIDFFDQNSGVRPILIEQNVAFLHEFPLAEKLAPHSNLLLRYLDKSSMSESSNPGKGFGEYKHWLEEELALPGIQKETTWIQKVSFYIPSFAAYFHSAGYYKEEMEALTVMREFLGLGGAAWYFKMVNNLILQGKLEEARETWQTMKKQFPDFFETWLAEGLLFSKEGNFEKAFGSFKIASEKNQKSFRPYFESADIWITLKDPKKARQALAESKARIASLGELKQVQKKLQQLRTF